MKPHKLALAWPTLAHATAWAAFLWIVLWPFTYQGVEVQPIQAGSREAPQVTYLSASYVETNGLWAVFPLLVPVLLTGLAVLAVWIWNPVRWTRNAFLWVLAVLCLGFCVLGYLSFGILFLPAALLLMVTAAVGMFQAPRPAG